MALVQRGYRLNVAFTETSGKVVRRSYEAPAISFADFAAFATAVQTALTGLIAEIQNVTASVISAYQLEELYVENALVLPAGAENQNQALWTGKISGDPSDSGIISIPAAFQGIFQTPTGPGHDIVDMNDLAVIAFINNFVAPNGAFTISDGEKLEAGTIAGVRRNVKSSKT